jgi:hypothetical protein
MGLRANASMAYAGPVASAMEEQEEEQQDEQGE